MARSSRTGRVCSVGQYAPQEIQRFVMTNYESRHGNGHVGGSVYDKLI